MAEYYLDDSQAHPFWDNSLSPRIEIESGDTVIFDCREPLDNQVTPDSGPDVLATWDATRVHPLCGPVWVKGAKPGDTLEVEVLNFQHKGWGWTGIVGGSGLLPSDFNENFLQHWRLEGNSCFLRENNNVEIPFEPFCGVIGVAPAEAGRIHTFDPSHSGGHVDIRGLTTGARAFFPVLTEGALFSTGDCHAAQGDGEVCLTAIEAPLRVTLRFHLRKDIAGQGFRFITPSPLARADTKGYYCTSAYGEDLYVNAQNAVRSMIEWIVETYGFSRNQAYCLCSVAGDLKISLIVTTQKVVSFYMPLSIFKVL